MLLNELLKELGIPERKLDRKVHLAKDDVSVYSGGSKEGYHGYGAGYKVYDPYAQLTINVEDTSCQYANEEMATFSYKGEKPAAVTYSMGDLATNVYKYEIYLFLPKGQAEKIIFKAQEKKPVGYPIPARLLQKWIREVSEDEGRDPKFWQRYSRVERKVEHKALVYAAHQFAANRPDDVGVIHDIWGGYTTDRGNSSYGTSIFIKNGKVEFIDYDETFPEVLQSKYGVTEFYPIKVDMYAAKEAVV